jgi:hypothetical protein
MTTVTSMDILASMSGFQQGNNGSADKPIKQATIDPAFVPASFLTGTLPKVTFEGESTLSTKFYPVASPYWPHPNDRVWMVPIGTTYLIAGSIEPSEASVYVGANVYIPNLRKRVTQNLATVNSGTVTTDEIVQSLVISNMVVGRWYEIGWHGNVSVEQSAGQTVSSFVSTLRRDATNVRRKRTATTQGGDTTIYAFEIKQEFLAVATSATFNGLLSRSGTGNIRLSVPSTLEVAVMYLDYVRG